MERSRSSKVISIQVYVFVLCLFKIIAAEEGNDIKELRILGFLAMTGQSGWLGGPAQLPAMRMAIDDTDAYKGLLDGYKLTYTVYDEQVCT